jgi:surface polysaccharide O-acyltransferase-like enzyme
VNRQKNETLDLIKLFASYMVIFIHVTFHGQLGYAMDALARFAVPIFFLVSGFFSYRISPDKIKSRARAILKLLIIAVVVYTLFNVVMLATSGGVTEIVGYFRSYADLTTLAKLILLNVPVSSVHLWYLFAMLYVYVAFYFATVLRLSEKVMWVISFSLLGVHLLLGEFLSFFDMAVPYSLLRNFLFMGIPFFGLGLFARKHEEALRTVPASVIWAFLAVGMLESVCSRLLGRRNELYLGSVLILFGLVIEFIRHSHVTYPRWVNELTRCSTYIYLFHIAIASVFTRIYALFQLSTANFPVLKNLHPLLVCVASTALAFGINKLVDLVSFKKKKE